MKLFKRMLAMLAVIAITVSGFAFAEESAPVIEVSDLVIEESTEETIEEIVEAAEETPEPTVEESAEAIAEAVSEEEMPESIDAPVLYSYYHRDEVPGNCPHTREYKTDEGRWNIEVLATDAATHTIRYTGEEYYHCPDCGYEYYLPIDGYREITENHKWSGDWCWECGYVNTCTHENSVLGYVSKWDVTVLSTDALSHTIRCRAQNRYDCPDCEAMLWEELEGYQTFTESHDWNERGDGSSYCWVCEYENACAHENKYIEQEGRAEQVLVSTDAKNHTFRFHSEILFECLNCGYRGWEISDEIQTVTEPHDWYEGKCWACDAVNSCKHLNSIADPYPGRTNQQVISSTASQHTISYQETNYYDCPDCNEQYSEVSPGHITVTEEHRWHNGECSECGAQNSCSHPELILESTGRIPKDLISYDEKVHTCVFVERSWYYCPNCGESLREDGSESFTATEPHQWWNGECEFCPAINPCSHENQYVDYVSNAVLKVLSVTATTHTIECCEEFLYICPDCGQESWEMQEEVLTKTEKHDWYEGKCWACDAENSCKHPNKTFNYSYWEIVKLLSTTALKHTAEVRDVNGYTCPDCGEDSHEPASSTYTLSAAHELNENGVCYDCGYRTECTHSNAFACSSYEYYGNGRKVDARTHSMTYYFVEYTRCPDCGFHSETRSTPETRLENHVFENGSCWICGYTPSCAHKNTYVEDGQIYKGCEKKNSEEHVYSFTALKITYCADCGAEISRKENGTTTNTQLHTLNYANICTDCNYESSCSHPKKEKIDAQDEYASPFDLNNHIVVSQKYDFYICERCNCELYNLSSYAVAGTRLEKHSFKNGKCTECDLYEVECIHEYDKNGKCKLCGKEQKVELEAIVLPRSLQLFAGETYELIPSLTPSNAAAELKYSSSDTKVASVSSDGVITAKKAGEAVITVRSGDVKASCTIIVVKKIEKISLNRSSLTLRLNASSQLTAILEPADAASDLLWTSSNFSAVSVDQDGLVTANAYGSAVITVSSNADPAIKASCTVTVSDDLPEISLGLSVLTLAEKQTFQLKPEMLPSADAEFSYSSSDSQVASVSSSGLISAKKTGSAVITVSSDNGAEASLSVTVKKAPSKVSISASKQTVGAGESFQLSASVAEDCHTSLSWSTSNSKVATVDENGFVTTLKAGKANITVKTHNGKSAKCAVTVNAAPESISLSESSLTLCEGESASISASLSKNSASTISWSVSGDAVTVDNGKITAVKLGSATVTATTFNGLSASCSVSVRPAPTHILLSADQLRLSEKQSFTLEAQLMAGEEAAAGKLSFASSNTKAATVSAAGVITAKKAGKTEITVTASNGVKAVCTLTVYAAPTKVSLNAKTATIGVGETFELLPGYSSAEALTTFTYSTSNAKVASIEQMGDACVVTALSAGKANITIKTHNGKSAKCAITVKAAPETISLSAASLVLGEGQSTQLSVSLPKNTAAQIIWSSDSDAVTVADGTVTAVKAGSATVYATTKNGLASASCTVTVKPAPEKVLVEDAVIVVGQKLNLDVKMQAGDEIYDGAYSLKLSSSSSVLSMDKKTGMYTAKKAGTAFITVTAYNGVSAECIVTVYAAPKSVKLSASKQTLAVGESFELTAKPNPVDAYTDGYTVTMDREGIVSVDGEGGVFTVTAENAGTVKITIATSNGKKASCAVTVKKATVVSGPTVWIAPTSGEKYHTKDCRSIKDAVYVEELSLNEAVNSGYTACGICQK